MRTKGDRWTRNLSESDRRRVEALGKGFESYREISNIPGMRRKTFDKNMQRYTDYVQRALDDVFFIFENWLNLPKKDQRRWIDLMFKDEDRCHRLLWMMLGAHKQNFRLQMDFIDILQKAMTDGMTGYTLTFSVQPGNKGTNVRDIRQKLDKKKFHDRQPSVVLY